MPYNPTLNRAEPQQSVGGSSFVTPGILGSPATVALSATTSDPSATTAVFTSATGFKEIYVYPAASIGTNHIVVGYSSTEDDATTVAAAVNAVVSNLSTTGGSGTAQTFVLNDANKLQRVTYDGSSTIKTIAGEANAGTLVYIVQGIS